MALLTEFGAAPYALFLIQRFEDVSFVVWHVELPGHRADKVAEESTARKLRQERHVYSNDHSTGATWNGIDYSLCLRNYRPIDAAQKNMPLLRSLAGSTGAPHYKHGTPNGVWGRC